jgi:hypothetical protein
VNFLIQGGQEKADAHVFGELLEFFFKPNELFLWVEEIVKPMDSCYIAFLMKFAHYNTPLGFDRLLPESHLHD